MTDLVDPEKIEAIVGKSRDLKIHWGRWNTTEGKVYILHSKDCVAKTPDLRDCGYSKALDAGNMRERDWNGFANQPVILLLVLGRLVPARVVKS